MTFSVCLEKKNWKVENRIKIKMSWIKHHRTNGKRGCFRVFDGRCEFL